MKKKILALAMASAMCLSLAACGSSSTSSTSATSSTTSTSSTSTTSTSSTASSGSVAVTSTDKFEFKFSTHDPVTSAIMKYTQTYFDAISKATNGGVTFTMYGSGSLAGVKDVGDMVESGGCDAGWLYTSYYPTEFTLSDVISLPLQGFGDENVATNVLWDLYENVPAMAKQWDSHYKLLELYANPAMIIETDKQINSVSDLKGLNMRCPAGAITDVLTAWGATPITMGPGDIYEAMEKGNIDGYIFEPVGTTSFSLQEVTKYYSDTALYTGAFGVVLNSDDWDKLPADYQAAISAISGRKASLEASQTFVDAVSSAKKTIQDAGGTFYTPSDTASFQTAADTYAKTWCTNLQGVDDGAAYLKQAQTYAAQYTK